MLDFDRQEVEDLRALVAKLKKEIEEKDDIIAELDGKLDFLNAEIDRIMEENNEYKTELEGWRFKYA